MAKGIPDNVLKMLADADERNGFPAGTMQSIMQQETGGNLKYLDDPTQYHYAPNAKGKRIAGHTGKVSTAFGPFGILESTGAKPGYGVAPLKDKSLAEQVRFASEYLAGRSKQAGSLEAGLAGYGEGAKYAKQVVARIPDAKGQPVPKSILAMPDDQMPQLSSLPMAQAPVAATPARVAAAQGQAMPEVAAPAAIPQQVAMAPANAWGGLNQLMFDQNMRPQDIDYASAARMQPQQAAMANEEMAMLQADNTERTQSMLKRFNLGRYSQGLERYEATIPEFTRPA